MSAPNDRDTLMESGGCIDLTQGRRPSKEIVSGCKLCKHLIQLVQERADIEKNYAHSLETWSTQWTEAVRSLSSNVPTITLTSASFDDIEIDDPLPESVCDEHEEEGVSSGRNSSDASSVDGSFSEDAESENPEPYLENQINDSNNSQSMNSTSEQEVEMAGSVEIPPEYFPSLSTVEEDSGHISTESEAAERSADENEVFEAGQIEHIQTDAEPENVSVEETGSFEEAQQESGPDIVSSGIAEDRGINASVEETGPSEEVRQESGSDVVSSGITEDTAISVHDSADNKGLEGNVLHEDVAPPSSEIKAPEKPIRKKRTVFSSE